MAGTDLSGYANQVLVGGRTPLLRDSKTTTANCKPGYIVAGVAANEPDIVEASGTIVGGVGSGVLGVLKENSDLDLDDVFVDNTNVDVIPKGSGSVVLVPVESNFAAIKKGDRLVVSEATNGMVQGGEFTTATTPDVAELKVATDQARYMQKNFVGYADEDSPNIAAVRWIKCRI